MTTHHPLHAALMRLHLERRELLHALETAAINDGRTEDILISISENRGETRAYLRFLGDEVLTRPAGLDDHLSPDPVPGGFSDTLPAILSDLPSVNSVVASSRIDLETPLPTFLRRVLDKAWRRSPSRSSVDTWTGQERRQGDRKGS